MTTDGPPTTLLPCYEKHLPPESTVIFGVVFDVLTFVAYLPQIVKLFKRTSNEGLSMLTLLFTNIGNIASVFNTINSNWEQITCCASLNGYQCIQLTVGLIEMVIIWLSWYVIFILCLVFFPKKESAEERRLQDRTKKAAITSFVLYFLFFVCGGFVVTIYWNILYRGQLIFKATDSMWGVVSSAMIVVVWLPQLYMTYKAKTPGSLSVLMLFFTAPGGYITVYFLGVALHNTFWVWVPTLISASLQTTLLIMCIYYEYWIKWCGQSKEGYGAINESDETGSAAVFSTLK